MRARNPLTTAFILSLAISVPAAMAVAQGERASVTESKKADKGGKNKGGKGGQNNGGGGGGEDLTRTRFHGLDTNRDGEISRDEWPGNDNSFDQHDWNGDGVLSGIEVTPGSHRPVDFNSLDRNDDGRISLSEWPGGRFLFTLLDDNQDNFLSAAELGQSATLARGRLEDVFRALDTDRDSRIGLTEWPGNATLFDRVDTSNDNFISLDELRRAASGQGGGGEGEAALEEAFNRMDANNDDRLSRSEWRGKSRHFDRMDRNRDGFLSLDELLRR